MDLIGDSQGVTLLSRILLNSYILACGSRTGLTIKIIYFYLHEGGLDPL